MLRGCLSSSTRYGALWAGLSTAAGSSVSDLTRLRNLGISAHIDSGKTTLTERILFYTGRIDTMHEVRGKDGVGAVMDSMDLEREKGITIQSAATYASWKDHQLNLIDTPGHVDFTIEVERALRVLDGAVLVLCGVAGVQAQSYTVDRQMRRYDVPRMCFINKLDRGQANPWKALEDLRSKLKHHAAAMQIPIGLRDEHVGVVDLITRKALYFEGEMGEDVVERTVPSELVEEMESKRAELIEAVADVDDRVAEAYLMEEEPEEELLHEAIRTATIGLRFTPVFLGSALKNCGVQPMLDGVLRYLPNPLDLPQYGLDYDKDEERVEVVADPEQPLVALAFKLEDGRFGQLTYVRVYQGTLRKGGFIHNTTTGKRIKVPRVVRMHSDKMEDVDRATAGDIYALFGVECASGDTFTDGSVSIGMNPMHVPDPVISLAVRPSKTTQQTNFGKALARFQREDPTFRVGYNEETKETVVSGMGELHLDIYMERMRREYSLDIEVGSPKVNYRETITRKVPFSYVHKKQSGGQGQYGKVEGFIEPLDVEGEDADVEETFVFENRLVGNNIPPEYLPGIEKGFRAAMDKGALSGHPVEGVRVVLEDGAYHPVDSSEMAFNFAAQYAFREHYDRAKPTILEPIMTVEVTVPTDDQGGVMSGLNRRKGVILGTETMDDVTVVSAEVALGNMFGYSTELRSITAGQGLFSMEYARHAAVDGETKEQLAAAFREAMGMAEPAKGKKGKR